DIIALSASAHRKSSTTPWKDGFSSHAPKWRWERQDALTVGSKVEVPVQAKQRRNRGRVPSLGLADGKIRAVRGVPHPHHAITREKQKLRHVARPDREYAPIGRDLHLRAEGLPGKGRTYTSVS